MGLDGRGAGGGVRAVDRALAIWEWLFAAALLVISILVFAPLAPSMPEGGLDPSWMFAVNEAVAQKLAIGRDIIFTFGPYAAIYTKSYHPATDQLALAGGFYLGLCFFLAAYPNFRRTLPLFQGGLLVVLGALAFTLDPLFFFYPLLVGAFIVRRAGQPMSVGTVALLALLLSPFGLLPLIKLSTLASCLGVGGLALLLLGYQKQWAALLTVIIVPAATMLLLWAVAGQEISGLAQYFVSGSSIIAGYPDALKTEAAPIEAGIYLLAMAVVIGLLWSRGKTSGVAVRICTALMFAGILFLGFKAGFMRADWHMTIAATCLLLAGLLAETLARSRAIPVILLVAGASAGVIFFCLELRAMDWSAFPGSRTAIMTGWDGARQRLFEPANFPSRYRAAMADLAAESGLPRLDGTSDMFGYDQASLVASGNLWNPRPVFHSYSAYTPGLAEINRQHLLGASRPDNVFFSTETVDLRLPSADDGPSWKALLERYEPARMLSGFLLLRPRNNSSSPFGPEHMEQLSGRMGETLNIPDRGDLVFARLKLRPTVAGRLLSLVFRPAALRLALNGPSGWSKSFPLISGTMESEFLLSPLITSSSEFGLLFAGDRLAHKQVSGVTVTSPGWFPAWESDYDLDLISVPYSGNAQYRTVFGITAAKPAPEALRIIDAAACDGRLGLWARLGEGPILLREDGVLSVEGWLAKSLDEGVAADEIAAVIEDGKGHVSFAPTTRITRRDVREHYKKPGLQNSGFSVNLSMDGLKGRQTLRMAYRDDEKWVLCENLSAVLDIVPVRSSAR